MKLRLRLRDLREDNDMSQAEMAKLLKCSQQTYSRYEAHVTEIPLQSLIFLANYYNTIDRQLFQRFGSMQFHYYRKF